MNEIQEKVLKIIREINNKVPEGIDIDLLSNGYLDSFSLANLVVELEETFSIDINGEDIIPENFRTIKAICDFICEKIYK